MKETVSTRIFILVVIFGSSSWMGTNSVWVQLPLLTAQLPEGWSLPSYLAAVVQIACIGPLVYTVIHKGCKNIVVPQAALIIFFLCLACVCQLGLAFFWSSVTTLGSTSYSLSLYLLLFGLAVTNAISNVLFMPFMAQFHAHYLNAYFVGMGFSSLVPSMLSLIQGTSNYECIENQPQYSSPRFSVAVFFFIIFCWTLLATISFIVLYIKGARKRPSACIQARGRNDENYVVGFSLKDRDINEGSPLNVVPLEVNEGIDDVKAHHKDENVLPEENRISGFYYAFLLLATAIVNAQMNGVIPSIQSYAALPYSQSTYHFGITFASIVSPLMSFVPFFCTVRSLPALAVMVLCSSTVTGFIVYLASLSPALIFNSAAIGSFLSITAAVVAAGLHSYLRVTFASLMRESHQSESTLFWCGVFIQIGSFLGSAVMFPLVNMLHLFQMAPPCQG